MVTPMPNAIDSPEEPAVWTMLFSRIVVRRIPSNRDATRDSVMASTATGIDAETVRPTLSVRYSDDAPKTIPKSEPTTTAPQVNSGMRAESGT